MPISRPRRVRTRGPEPWFILREMLQNALDEGGQFGVVEEEILPDIAGTILQGPCDAGTRISLGPKRTLDAASLSSM